jgi:hypothetical protein
VWVSACVGLASLAGRLGVPLFFDSRPPSCSGVPTKSEMPEAAPSRKANEVAGSNMPTTASSAWKAWPLRVGVNERDLCEDGRLWSPDGECCALFDLWSLSPAISPGVAKTASGTSTKGWAWSNNCSCCSCHRGRAAVSGEVACCRFWVRGVRFERGEPDKSLGRIGLPESDLDGSRTAGPRKWEGDPTNRDVEKDALVPGDGVVWLRLLSGAAGMRCAVADAPDKAGLPTLPGEGAAEPSTALVRADAGDRTSGTRPVAPPGKGARLTCTVTCWREVEVAEPVAVLVCPRVRLGGDVTPALRSTCACG